MAEELGPLVERRRANEALAASQERFQAVTEAAMDAIVSADSSRRLLTWNGGAERTFGWTAAEIVGKPLTVIIPERFRRLHEDGIARVRHTGASKLAGQVVELSGLRRDGREFRSSCRSGPGTGPRASPSRGCCATSPSASGPAARLRRGPGPLVHRRDGMGLAICRKIVEVLGAASASRATTGPTSASSCRRPWAPAGRATS